MFLRKPLVVRLLGLVLVPLSLLTVGVSSVRLNISPSLPYGLYRLQAVASPLTQEMLVVVHMPRWGTSTRPFLKPVAAVAGEWVCRVGQALVIHGEDYGPVYDAWRGEPFPSAIAADTWALSILGHSPPRHSRAWRAWHGLRRCHGTSVAGIRGAAVLRPRVHV